MRETRFRGLTDNGEWVYGDLVTDGHKSKNTFANIFPTDANEYDFDLCIQVKLETVGEFTGLQDKNGKDSYESQNVNYEFWIQTSVDPDSLGKTYKGKGIIEFIEGSFMINPTVPTGNPIPMHFQDLTFEIVED